MIDKEKLVKSLEKIRNKIVLTPDGHTPVTLEHIIDYIRNFPEEDDDRK